MNDTAWPFDQPPDCAVITLRSIVFGGKPVLRVTHDADDHGWQFLGAGDADMADAAVVADLCDDCGVIVKMYVLEAGKPWIQHG